MTLGHWILDDNGQPRLVDLMTWAMWLESSENRVVKQEWVGDTKVSTVFLGLDYNFGEGPPILWETMVFGGAMDQHQQRCAGNREQAEAMHQNVLERVQQAEGAKNAP